jgi:two-component system chemotaxis sensor kinase CheA
MSDDKSAYRDLFVQEAHEHVQNMNQALLKLEEDPKNKEHLDSAFRSAHTLKGMAATMGYDQIKELCKAIEELFDKFRKDEEKMSAEMASYLFKCFDTVQEMIDDENKKVNIEQYLRDLHNPAAMSTNASSQDEASQQQHSTLPQTIRVKMQDLDALVDLVGELLIAKMRLEQMVGNSTSADNRMRHTFMSLGRLVSDLQYQTMKLRLVPVEQIFNRFPRMIRDLSSSQGKSLKLEIEGLGIELDRTVLDAITDPLLHMLRNAADHAIEMPEEREAAGKPRTGTIKLIASKVGDRVMITVEDDGRGIDLEKVKAKAIEKKIITKEEADSMSEEDILNLLGTPGLSTAKQVTDISGRGVGMDVVFSQIEAVGGEVKIETRKGQGTRFTMIIPLSLAIIGGLLVTISNEKYVLPLSSVISTMRVDKKDIRIVHGKEVILFREQVAPLLRTGKSLGIVQQQQQQQQQEEQQNDKDDHYLTVVIVNKNGRPYGLIVDEFESKQEIVVKRLDSSSAPSSVSSEATILGDGKVALILDPARL